MEATVEQLTEYELERGKPMPDTIHGAIQANLNAELSVRYRHQFRFLSELSLATFPDGTTPDITIYPYFPLDYDNREAKRSDAPLTCIEIQSPSQSNEEMIGKQKIYFDFGVQSCWLVVPAMKGIFVYDRPGHYEFFHGNDTLRDAITGIELPLAPIFE